MSLGRDIRNSASWYKAFWIVFYWRPLLEALRLRRPEENRPGNEALAPSYPDPDLPPGTEKAEDYDPFITTQIPVLTEEEVAEFRAKLVKATRTSLRGEPIILPVSKYPEDAE